jgi:hypothetical protein
MIECRFLELEPAQSPKLIGALHANTCAKVLAGYMWKFVYGTRLLTASAQIRKSNYSTHPCLRARFSNAMRTC